VINFVPLLVSAAFLSVLTAPAPLVDRALPMGEEAFGNGKVPKQPGWAAGVLSAANDPHRVYMHWVNGSEDFVFRGDADAMNAALKLFAAIKDDKNQVVVVAGTGETKSFEGKVVPYDWHLYVPTDIALFFAQQEKGTNVMVKHPRLMIHITKQLPVEKLKIPAGLSVLGVEDLVATYRSGLASQERRVRIHSLSSLGRYAYVDGSLAPLAAALQDKDEIIRIVAARTLNQSFGIFAKKHLPQLEALRDRSSDKWRSEYVEICKSVRAAKSNPRSPVVTGVMAAVRVVLDDYDHRQQKQRK
tara:strand:+ start:25797 stop:26699 length:903 start_codon:yes stop_codon:yes gene_type:complete